MKRLWRAGRPALLSCLRPLLRSLTALGAFHIGLTEHHHAPLDRTWPPLPFRGAFGHAGGGPPPAHPERLREDLPLSRQEQRIARELWPAHYPEQSAPGGS